MAHAMIERFPNPASRPTALVAVNDRTAIGALRGFYELGVRVPEDVAVVGFHDIEQARYTTPALTTIAHPRVELGEMAAEALFTRLEGEEVEVRDRIVPVSLMVRESSGAQRSASSPTTATASTPTAPSGPPNGVGGRRA
jgi:DNA-binding LacI/PurR family transcriptional regulator